MLCDNKDDGDGDYDIKKTKNAGFSKFSKFLNGWNRCDDHQTQWTFAKYAGNYNDDDFYDYNDDNDYDYNIDNTYDDHDDKSHDDYSVCSHNIFDNDYNDNDFDDYNVNDFNDF